MSQLRRTPFYRAFHRANLFLGGERKLVMFTALVCAGLIISSQSWWVTGICAVLWVVFLGLFRQMAKKDPYLSQVYLRHIQYQSYYPPKPRR